MRRPGHSKLDERKGGYILIGHRRHWGKGLQVLARVAVLAMVACASRASAQNCNGFAEGAVISNGTVEIGVNCEGHLNTPYSPDPLGIGAMGLRYVPTGNASTEP